jgi:uncharacterized protein
MPIHSKFIGAAIAGLALLAAQELPDKLALKDYRPRSIFKTGETRIEKPKYPVIDVHYHSFQGNAGPAERLKSMDEAGIEKSIILTGVTGARFDAVYAEFGKYPQRFQVWCGLDAENFSAAEVERCARLGAKGVGEISDKGKGVGRSGVHPDDPRLDAIWEKCAELKLPVNLHIADPRWTYDTMDATNDGLMDAFKWRLDNQPDIVKFDGMIEILDRTLERHPRTTFIACHLANLDFDLARLGQLLDKHPNLYADISARLHYIGTIPRAAAAFIEKYQDRILYGTDTGFRVEMYRATFRALESTDDHYYEWAILPNLHWPLYGLGLNDRVLRKLYRDNALKILKP